ncbi:MAG: PspC domain-containing protein, partial [Chitinophagaceae bacterium]
MIQKFRDFLELHAFGVCSALGERLGIASAKIRMWFIYISFLTLGSPVVLYFVLAFV